MDNESFDIVELDDGTIKVLHAFYEVEEMGGNDIETSYCFDMKNSSRLRRYLQAGKNKNLRDAFKAAFKDVYSFREFCDKKRLEYSISQRY